jgi:hypothetical protein
MLESLVESYEFRPKFGTPSPVLLAPTYHWALYDKHDITAFQGKKCKTINISYRNPNTVTTCTHTVLYNLSKMDLSGELSVARLPLSSLAVAW